MNKIFLKPTNYFGFSFPLRCFSSTPIVYPKPPDDDNKYVYKRSEYATPWYEPDFPQWQQFEELSSAKRKYYHNRETNVVSWTHPSNPDQGFDIIKYERDLARAKLTPVPAHAPAASLIRRLSAAGIDIGLSFVGGLVFAAGVYIDLWSIDAALPSVGFSAWVAFLARDMLFEEGTRSLGKRLMKLEIVTSQGTLPSRYNTFFRQIYLPLYAGSTVLMPYIILLPISDAACILFTKQHLRIGDVIGRTRVIAELPDRATRLEEKRKADLEESLLD